MCISSLVVKKLAAALLFTVIVFVPISSWAETVIYEGNNATGIKDLDVAGEIFDITFVFGPGIDFYGNPGKFTFSNEESSFAAVSAIHNALNSAAVEIRTVGPNKTPYFYLAAAEDPLDPGNQDSPLAYGAWDNEYNTRQSNTWTIGIEGSLSGVVIPPPLRTDSYTWAVAGDLGVPPPTCDPTHLDLCTSQGACTGAGGYWYNNKCNSSAEPPVTDTAFLSSVNHLLLSGDMIPPGPGQVEVPNVVGQVQASAEGAITAAGLIVGSVSQQSSGSVAVGNVISQDPTAGTQVPSGSAVDLVISTGPAQGAVVIFDSQVVGKAIEIQNLDVAGTLYNVAFLEQRPAVGVYGDFPGVFTFTTGASAQAAVDAVNAALNATNTAVLVGEDPGLAILLNESFNVGWSSETNPANAVVIRAGSITGGNTWGSTGQDDALLYGGDERTYATFTMVP